MPSGAPHCRRRGRATRVPPYGWNRYHTLSQSRSKKPARVGGCVHASMNGGGGHRNSLPSILADRMAQEHALLRNRREAADQRATEAVERAKQQWSQNWTEIPINPAQRANGHGHALYAAAPTHAVVGQDDPGTELGLGDALGLRQRRDRVLWLAHLCAFVLHAVFAIVTIAVSTGIDDPYLTITRAQFLFVRNESECGRYTYNSTRGRANDDEIIRSSCPRQAATCPRPPRPSFSSRPSALCVGGHAYSPALYNLPLWQPRAGQGTASISRVLQLLRAHNAHYPLCAERRPQRE